MNFLRQFLQGKDPTASKPGNERDSKDDLYPLSRSATDPSHCVSPNKSKSQSVPPNSIDNDHSFAGGAALNRDISQYSYQPLNSSDERKLSSPYFFELSADEKNYQGRPSFKVEGLLFHHLNSSHSEAGSIKGGSLDVSEQASFESDLNSLNEPRNEFFDCEEQLLTSSSEPPTHFDIKRDSSLETTLPRCASTEEFANSLENFASRIVSDAIKSAKESRKDSLKLIQEIELSAKVSSGVQPLACTGFSLEKKETQELEKDKFSSEVINFYCESSDVASTRDQETGTQSVNVEPQSLEVAVQKNTQENPEANQIQGEIHVDSGSHCEEGSDFNSENKPGGESNNYFEFVFEEPKKSIKLPPKLLGGRRNPGTSKKRARNRAKSASTDKSLEENNCTTKSSEKGPESILNQGKSENLSPNPEKIVSLEVESNQLIETKKSAIWVESSSSLPIVRKEEETEADSVDVSLSESDKETLEIKKQIEKDLENLTSHEIATPTDFSDSAKLSEPEVNYCFPTEIAPRNLPVDKAHLENASSSSISISCYGNEEFEVLGNEANRLAEELSTAENTVLSDLQNMEEKAATQERTKSFENSPSQNESGNKSESKKMNTQYKTSKGSAKKDSLTLQVNDSEAGPDIAPGLTSSDLKCASLFFKEAAELESQIRRNIAASVGSLNEYPGESSTFSESDVYSSNAKSAVMSCPPHEERSAPEGTSSPDPRSLEDSEVRSRLQRSPECSSNHEVNELLKKQALEFEEKLLRQGIVAAEKEKELHELLREEQKQMQKVTASRDALLKLVEQYKGMLASLLAEKEKAGTSQEEKIRTLENEKQQAMEDLNNVEAAFSDVHRKYERTKQIVDSLRRNEETLRNAVADYEEKLVKQERKFAELQKHAEEKVRLANEEFETMRRANDQEMTKMGALLKKAEMKIISLQESLDRKTRENQELTQLCDDLISKVGS